MKCLEEFFDSSRVKQMQLLKGSGNFLDFRADSEQLNVFHRVASDESSFNVLITGLSSCHRVAVC